MLTFSDKSFVQVLPHLLKVWPEQGFRSVRSAKRILSSVLERTERGRIQVDPSLHRNELQKHGVRVASMYSTPWKYTKYFQKGTDLRRSAVKVRPGATMPLTIGGADTTAYVNSARRLKFRGNPNYMRLDINLNTEMLPVILERESKCTCLYCGTEPTAADEFSCRACGAQLPAC